MVSMVADVSQGLDQPRSSKPALETVPGGLSFADTLEGRAGAAISKGAQQGAVHAAVTSGLGAGTAAETTVAGCMRKCVVKAAGVVSEPGIANQKKQDGNIGEPDLAGSAGIEQKMIATSRGSTTPAGDGTVNVTIDSQKDVTAVDSQLSTSVVNITRPDVAVIPKAKVEVATRAEGKGSIVEKPHAKKPSVDGSGDGLQQSVTVSAATVTSGVQANLPGPASLVEPVAGEQGNAEKSANGGGRDALRLDGLGSAAMAVNKQAADGGDVHSSPGGGDKGATIATDANGVLAHAAEGNRADKVVEAAAQAGAVPKLEVANGAPLVPHGLSGTLRSEMPGTSVPNRVEASGSGAMVGVLRGGTLAGTQASHYETGDGVQHGVMAASPKMLEVGIGNGSHGWLRIRAEMDGGVVTASLSTKTVAGQEMLHRELPSLTTYLQEQRVAVHSVVIDRSASSSSLTSGTGGGRGASDSGAQTSGSAGQEQNGGRAVESNWGGRDDAVSRERLNLDDGLLPIAVGAIGGWLNVRV